MGKILPLRGIIYSKFNRESDLAATLGWSRQRLWKITTGKKIPDLFEVRDIADALGVSFMEVANIFLQK